MNENAYGHPPIVTRLSPIEPEPKRGWKKILVPLGVLGALLLKAKGVIIPLLKFFPVLLKTGGTMILSIGFYAMAWGWWFALGFVLLLLIHECGHLIAARRVGIKVGLPVFIPFMGAFIALKEAPKNAWVEAQVGIGGPILGTLGAMICYVLYRITDQPLFCALAYSGFFLNLFNLAPAGFLDGGRVVTALSPWLWIPGVGVLGLMLWYHFNPILLLVFIMALFRLFSLFRKRTEAEQRYFEVAPWQRWFMGALYFGLVAFLVLAMQAAFLQP